MSSPDSLLERVRAYRSQLDEAPGTWPAKRRLAAAVRELMDSLCATDAPAEELLAIAEQVKASARRFANQPRMTNPPGVAESSLAAGMETFMDRSPLVGLANPLAAPLELSYDEATQVVQGSVFFGNAYEGAPGCVHGGFVAAVFDEALGMTCGFTGSPGMTGQLTTRYRRPTPLKTPLRVEARIDRVDGRKIHNSGEIYAGDVRVAEAIGLFIAIDRTKFGELRAAQLEREKHGVEL